MELEMKLDMSSFLQSIELIGDVQIREGFYTRKEDERIYLVTQMVRNPLATRSCPTLATRWTSLPGASVHGISQARILEWVAIPFSRGSSRPRD